MKQNQQSETAVASQNRDAMVWLNGWVSPLSRRALRALGCGVKFTSGEDAIRSLRHYGWAFVMQEAAK